MNNLALLSIAGLFVGILFSFVFLFQNLDAIDHNATFTSSYFDSSRSVTFGYDEGIFEITNVSIHQGPYETKIIGLIENKHPDHNTIENVSLAIQAYDKDNRLIGVAEGQPQMTTFRLGDKTAFEISDNDAKSDLDHIFIQILATNWGTENDNDTSSEKEPSQMDFPRPGN